ncbi:MAG: hypothetical protein MK198_00265 [Gracilimonas sp.]|uniref:hypothetical protein n=1 Tax=Gracilimonas sp. TaxID=1974203 RepID=UPI0037514F6F|nr:hypothetical protein [Gracilimonas sp.]
MEDQNHFASRIKSNTLYEPIVENELSDGEEGHILKDELIYMTGQMAIKVGMDQVKPRSISCI